MAITPLETARKRQTAGLRPPFKRGQSGNPNGRPKEPLILKDFKQFAKQYVDSEEFQKTILKLAKKGNAKALKLILHYGVGKPKDVLEVKGGLRINVIQYGKSGKNITVTSSQKSSALLSPS